MKRMIIAAAICLGLAACNKSAGMHEQTYTLHHLTQDEAMALLTPYIREGGYLSGKNKFITVREKPDRLKAIEDLLKQYDGSGDAVDIMLNMQIIEADGFTERDPAIADVEGTLRQMFKYEGYKLVASVQVPTREDGSFMQQGDEFRIRGQLQHVSGSGASRAVPITVELTAGKAGIYQMQSTVTAPLDKPTVLGESAGKGAIILVIRPTIVQR